MPEGDTVWLSARQLDEALAGRELTHSDFRVPQLATVSLVGQTVLKVVPRGKHMLTRLSSGLTLHTHFRMDGSWRVYRPGQRWTGGPVHQVRLVLANDEAVAVGYRMPVVELVRDESTVVGHLGPDVMDDDSFDAQEAVRRLSADPDREIGMALLDQRNLAGIGNLYRAEALFLEGVTPWSRVADVDLARVVDRSVRLMRANRGKWKQSTTGFHRHDEEHWVFERAGRPCHRCGSRVLIAEQGEPPQQRLTYWCPRCQVGPAPEPMPYRARRRQV
ncbi:MAG: DNA glycosylase [Actinomycetota bacterium]|nr:DNA glycosylase [Actinomycetota bacterium]